MKGDMSNLWDGVRFKLDMAQFYLFEMQQDLVPATVQGPQVYYQRDACGGSGCLDSFCQFISGAWRMRPTRRWAVQAGCHSTRDRACVRQARDAA